MHNDSRKSTEVSCDKPAGCRQVRAFLCLTEPDDLSHNIPTLDPGKGQTNLFRHLTPSSNFKFTLFFRLRLRFTGGLVPSSCPYKLFTHYDVSHYAFISSVLLLCG